MSKRSRPVKTAALRSQRLASSAPPLMTKALHHVGDAAQVRALDRDAAVVEEQRRLDHEAGGIAARVLDAHGEAVAVGRGLEHEGSAGSRLSPETVPAVVDRAVPCATRLPMPDHVGVEVDGVAAAVVGQGDVGARDIDAAEGHDIARGGVDRGGGRGKGERKERRERESWAHRRPRTRISGMPHGARRKGPRQALQGLWLDGNGPFPYEPPQSRTDDLPLRGILSAEGLL